MHTQKSLISATSGKLFAKHRPQTFSQKFFSKISLLSKFCFSFARTSFLFFLNSPKFCTQKLASPLVPTSHNSTLSTRALFLHFGRCTYHVTVDRRLLATSVSCPHLPSPLTTRLTPSKKLPTRPHPAEHQPNSPQIKIPPHLQTPFPAKKSTTYSDARTIKIRNLRAQYFCE